MRLVFVTQVLDRRDAVLGFVVRWVEGLARHCERVRVLALEVGDTSELPDQVDFRVLGRRGNLRRFWRYRRFLVEAFRGDGFDTLLTHMVPRYSLVAARRARRQGVGHFMWYTSKGVDARLRRAVDLVDKVFTASPESLRVETEKRVVTGHGIDVAHFDRGGATPDAPPRLLSVGRLTPAKDPVTVLEALTLLRHRGRQLVLDWAGSGLAASDAAYIDEVRSCIAVGGLEDAVVLHGAVPYPEVAELYRRATLFVSASRTGSVDKAVLEAMASGRPALTCNESFRPILAELGPEAEDLLFEPGDAGQLAQRVEAQLARTQAERDALGARLRAIVARDHEVDALMGRLVREMGAARDARVARADPADRAEDGGGSP